MATQLHLAENTFALHFFLERLERLIDIIVANENLHWADCSFQGDAPRIGAAKNAPRRLPVQEGARYNMGVPAFQPPPCNRSIPWPS